MTTPTVPESSRWSFWYRALFLLVLVFVSRVVWYDLRVVRRELLQPGQMRFLFASYGACMTPLIVLLWGRSTGRSVLERPVWWFAILAWYGLLPAMVWRNQPLLVAQDVFKLSLLPAGYLGARLVFRGSSGAPGRRAGRFLLVLAVVTLVFQAARFTMLQALKQPGAPLIYGTIFDVLPPVVFLSFALVGRGPVRWWCVMGLFLSIALTLPGQKRTVLVCLAVGALLIAWKTLSMRPFVIVVAAYCAAVAVSGVLLFDGVESLLGADGLKRVVRTDISASIGTESMRFAEFLEIVGRLDEVGPAGWLFGFGHGASFEIIHPVRGLREVHSVHYTPVAMLFRYGVLGLLFYAALALHVLQLALRFDRQLTENERSTALAAKAYVLAALVGSLVIFGLVDDLLVGVFLAMLKRPGETVPMRAENGA